MKLFKSLFIAAAALLAVSCGTGSGGTPVDPVDAKSITLNHDSYSFYAGDTCQLEVNFEPVNATYRKVFWSVTQGDTVIDLDDNGLVTAKSLGIAKVKARTRVAADKDEFLDAYCTFTVLKTPIHPESISLDQEVITVKEAKTVRLTATVLPTNADNKSVTWSSANEQIATVENGVVTGVSVGETTVSATTVDGELVASCVVTVIENIDVTGVKLNYESAALEVGDKLQLVASVLPANAHNKNVTWKVASGSASLSVDSNGLVTAIGKGTGKIRVTTVENSKYATCSITVADKVIAVESVEISDTALSIKQGQNATLTASVVPSYATNKNITWSSSDESVATVNSNGVVSALKQGHTAKIYASSADGSKKAECLVTVTEPQHVESVSLSKTSGSVKEGKTLTLSASILPNDAYDKSVTWSSSNIDVATVNNGVVTAKAPGSSRITVTTVDRGLTAYCDVTVTEKGAGDAWTIMVYICGSNLESQGGLATADIKEILKVAGQPDDVNILIETGGASSWKSTYGISASKLERWHVEDQKLVKEDSLTYASMGKSSTLQSFVTWGLQNYPAEDTGLILWNHGGGLDGVCYDEKSNDDCLTSSEVVSAVSGAFTATNRSLDNKMTFIGYDACLMGVQDIAEFNSPYFHYMVSSQETEAGEGWDYDNWVDDLYDGKDTLTVLKAICNSFISSQGSTSDQTLSVLDLDYAEEYMEAWEAMSAQLLNKVTSSNKSSFNSIVIGSYDFESAYGYGLYDAKDFVNKLKSNSTFNPGTSYIDDVLDAHAKFVAYNKTGSSASKAYGLSLQWKGSYISYKNGTNTHFTNWCNLCNTYGTASSGGGWW